MSKISFLFAVSAIALSVPAFAETGNNGNGQLVLQ